MIRWTPEESLAVMAEALRLENMGVKLPQQKLMLQAEKCLPPERRRGMVGSGTSSPFMKRMRHKANSGHLQPATQPPPEFPPVESVLTPSPPLVEAPTPAPLEPQIITIERKVYIKQEPDWGRIPTVTLARILLERLASLEETNAALLHIEDVFKRKREAEAKYDHRLDPRPPDQKPAPEPLRVCIIGLLPEQQHEVATKTANVSRPVKLRFFDSGHGEQDLPMLVDHCIVTKFTTHSWWEKCQAKLPPDCITFTNGGVSAVVQKIFDLTSIQRPNGAH